MLMPGRSPKWPSRFSTTAEGEVGVFLGVYPGGSVRLNFSATRLIHRSSDGYERPISLVLLAKRGSAFFDLN
jgi:hypothetical protein